jgi:hypothetical protein
MKSAQPNMITWIRNVAGSARLRNTALSVLVVAFVLQVYFVRELLAAELLFGAIFAVLFVLCGAIYLLGAITEQGFDWTEVGVHVLTNSARRGYAALEEISRKPFRHPRSESAQ